MQVIQKIERLDVSNTLQKPEAAVAVPAIVHLVRLGFRLSAWLAPRRGGQWAYQLFSKPRRRAQHKVSDEIIEKARVFEFMYTGRILKAYEWGRGEKTVLLIHGWESRGTAMRSFVPSLVEKGYKVVAFDAPAHGNSDGERTNIRQFGGAIKAIINQIGGVHAIIGHSFGGGATMFTMAHLDQELELEKLVLVASPSDFKLAIESFSSFMRLSPKVYQQFEKIVEEKVGRPLSQANVHHFDTKYRISETMIVHDELDSVISVEEGKTYQREMHNARLLLTKGLGHYQLMKHPWVIEKVVDFIDEE